MNIELYVCEGEVHDDSDIYIPDFTHHEHRNFLFPIGHTCTTLAELKAQGFSLLKTIDITPQISIEDKHPVTRYLLVVGQL